MSDEGYRKLIGTCEYCVYFKKTTVATERGDGYCGLMHRTIGTKNWGCISWIEKRIETCQKGSDDGGGRGGKRSIIGVNDSE